MNPLDENSLWQCFSNYLTLKKKYIRNKKTSFEIRVEFLKFISDHIKLDISSIHFEKALFIRPDNLVIMDNAWKKILKQNFQISQEDLNLYFNIKYNPLVSYEDTFKFLKFLSNHDFTLRENKEKILKSNTLVILLNVDGFLGYSFEDVLKYTSNLRQEKCFCHNLNMFKLVCECDDLLNLHMKTVRQMYFLSSIKDLSGTDATSIIFLALLNIYKKYAACKKYLKIHINDVENYILKNSIQSPFIRKAKANLDELIQFYTSNISNVSKIAIKKINELH